MKRTFTDYGPLPIGPPRRGGEVPRGGLEVKNIWVRLG